MTLLKRTLLLLAMSQEKMTKCPSTGLMFHSSQGIFCSDVNQKHRISSRPQYKHQNRQKSKERPRWLQRMHQSLVKYDSLPQPRQDIAVFDGNQLQSYSTERLISMVWDVRQINKNANLSLVELWRRMDSMHINQILSVADIFFIKNMQSNWYLGAMTAYFQEMVDVMELTPSQLTHLAFHVLNRHRTVAPRFVLTLEDIITRSVHSFSLNQLAIICHSFFTSQLYIRSMDLLENISLKLVKEFDSLDNHYLPVFMKTMRYSNFIKISFYKDLGDLLVEKKYLDKFRTLAQIMHIAHAYASVRVSHPVLFSYILNCCCHSKFTFRLKDLSKLIWSCGTLVTDHPEDISAIRKILTYLDYNLSLKESLDHPDNLVDLVNGLYFLNIHSDFLLNKLFHPKSVSAIIEMGKAKESKLPQLNLIDGSLDIEHSNYTGRRLSKESKSIISSLLGNFPMEREMSLKKGLREAVVALQSLLGDNKVLCTKILPHLYTTDIILLWDTTESKFTDHEDWAKQTPQQNKRYMRLAVQILSNMQTSYDGKPLGMLHIKLKQLETVGYYPVLIDADDAVKFVYGDIRSTQGILLKTISFVVGTDLTHLSSLQL